ncbi:hypothetical protein [Rhodococcus chondri]|uniref:DUF222 domain-containing protein n=1 Tax=Rhodococcus chondri TaxID=3065941 RepID=A0ABU7JP97_9NOCA|nr:hypothetical protein [Rhodococcus sp. CC-R104]MEE2031853.1 hypothetical protein [Rhodococcus sp. CC-R104]
MAALDSVAPTGVIPGERTRPLVEEKFGVDVVAECTQIWRQVLALRDSDEEQLLALSEQWCQLLPDADPDSGSGAGPGDAGDRLELGTGIGSGWTDLLRDLAAETSAEAELELHQALGPQPTPEKRADNTQRDLAAAAARAVFDAKALTRIRNRPPTDVEIAERAAIVRRLRRAPSTKRPAGSPNTWPIRRARPVRADSSNAQRNAPTGRSSPRPPGAAIGARLPRSRPCTSESSSMSPDRWTAGSLRPGR